MNMETELRSVLRDRSELIDFDRSRRQVTLKRAAKRRGAVIGAAALLAGVVALTSAWTGLWDREDERLAPVQQPERGNGAIDEPVTDVVVAEAPDGSWILRAGLNEGGRTLCLSLEGTGCTDAQPPEGFVLFTSFGGVPSGKGFLYGVAGPEVAVLELTQDGTTMNLRLRSLPRKLGIKDALYFVRPISGDGAGTLTARDREGVTVQQTSTSWGGAGPVQAIDQRASELIGRLGGLCRNFDFQAKESLTGGIVRPVYCERRASEFVHIKLYVFSDEEASDEWQHSRLGEASEKDGNLVRSGDWAAVILDREIIEEVRNRLIPG